MAETMRLALRNGLNGSDSGRSTNFRSSTWMKSNGWYPRRGSARGGFLPFAGTRWVAR